jgi:hypothetical protein
MIVTVSLMSGFESSEDYGNMWQHLTERLKVTGLTDMSRSKAEARFEQYREALRVELMKLASYVRLYRVLNERKRAAWTK